MRGGPGGRVVGDQGRQLVVAGDGFGGEDGRAATCRAQFGQEAQHVGDVGPVLDAVGPEGEFDPVDRQMGREPGVAVSDGEGCRAAVLDGGEGSSVSSGAMSCASGPLYQVSWSAVARRWRRTWFQWVSSVSVTVMSRRLPST